MLKKRNRFASFALVATLFVGCQTAPKTANYTAEEMFNSEVEVDVGRYPASDGGPVGTFVKLLRESSNGEKKAAEFMATLNERFGKTADFKEFKAKYGSKMTEAGLDGLSPELQAKILKDFLDNSKNAYRTLGLVSDEVATLRANANKLLGDIKNGGIENAHAKKTTFSNVEDKGLLTVNNRAGTGGSARGVRTDGGAISAANATTAMKQNSLKNIYEGLITSDNATFAGAEGKTRAMNLMKKEHEYRMLTGRSVLNVETCKDFDVAALESYARLQDDLITDIKANAEWEDVRLNDGKVVKRKKVCPELEAWAMARFQSKLGREGISAWTAVQEMAICKLAAADHAAASRSLASQNGGAIPSRAPSCK